MKKLFFVLVVVLVSAIAFASGAAEQEKATTEVVSGGTLNIGVNAQDYLQPLWYNHRQPKDFLYTDVYMETLLVFDKNGDPVPYLAESVTADVENLTYTIKLKEGIKFHDGSELTAELSMQCQEQHTSMMK